ncbi:TetR/AcrR family transcriptional regulator [Rhodococcus sp. R1101]|uniref:TetR/AcrR family transcriptional regulator n=1 Tax=Rhodococcus sp. R1101 TaxID=1170698 RepID=UPI001E53BB2B|nr:TetR family transcriptional regulator [Rhodococcus sp. R1101]
MPRVTDKRATVLDAAIELVGTEGLRALTHRRVDTTANVPAGSTSNYFRTRQALVEGVLDRLLARDRIDAQALSGTTAPASARGLEDLMHDYVMFVTGPDIVRTRARFAMFVEAMATPELRAGVDARRGELRTWVRGMLDALGAEDSATGARLLIDYLDGVILHRCTAGVDEPDPRPGIALAVRAALRTAA